MEKEKIEWDYSITRAIASQLKTRLQTLEIDPIGFDRAGTRWPRFAGILSGPDLPV
ncbi:MAG: hypothetical protein ACI92G_001869 [Candidatus Pelagisphaera sp.]|jgi:hypothetical protein